MVSDPLSRIFDGVSTPHSIFVIGKGGVGKTTVSVILADRLSKRGRTLIVSLDPAKHLLEYLGLDRPLEPQSIDENLDAMQIDVSKLAKKLGGEYAQLLRQVTPGLRILGLEDIVKAVRYAPGFEEEIFLRVLRDLYGRPYDYVVIDTPPTGVTHRILTLPGLYVFWLDRLIDLRTKIVSLRYTISRAMGRKMEPRDAVLSKLVNLKKEYSELDSSLRSPDRTSYVLVATPEPLPVYETRSTLELLNEMLGVHPKAIVVNKILPEDVAAELGIADVSKESLDRLKGLECGECVKLGIGYHRRAPRNLEEARELTESIFLL